MAAATGSALGNPSRPFASSLPKSFPVSVGVRILLKPQKSRPLTSAMPPPAPVSCTLTREPTAVEAAENGPSTVAQRPDSFGRFGRFGGKYVPETLMHALTELETAFRSLSHDADFQVISLSQFF